MPGICDNCRSRGVATDTAMFSALAPASEAVTWIVGKLICGSEATGRNGKAAIPTNATAAISNAVATGRRIKGSDRFMSCCQHSQGVACAGLPQNRGGPNVQFFHCGNKLQSFDSLCDRLSM